MEGAVKLNIFVLRHIECGSMAMLTISACLKKKITQFHIYVMTILALIHGILRLKNYLTIKVETLVQAQVLEVNVPIYQNA